MKCYTSVVQETSGSWSRRSGSVGRHQSLRGALYNKRPAVAGSRMRNCLLRAMLQWTRTTCFSFCSMPTAYCLLLTAWVLMASHHGRPCGPLLQLTMSLQAFQARLRNRTNSRKGTVHRRSVNKKPSPVVRRTERIRRILPNCTRADLRKHLGRAGPESGTSFKLGNLTWQQDECVPPAFRSV